MSVHGWLVLDKPVGLGSTNAVGAVKRALREAGHGKTKVGHGGTLDPLASGVLPIAIGEATKLAGRMLEASKIYDFTIGFGVETDTLDAEGVAVANSKVRPTMAEVERILPRFTGLIEQVPPAYSALKIDGARAYDLARGGVEVALAARAVTVLALDVTGASTGSAKSAVETTPPTGLAELVGASLSAITLTAHVSKGTYIRSLARDIARALDAVGHVTTLRRTRAGPFDLQHAISLDNLHDAARGHGVEALLRPIEAALDGIPAFPLTPDQAVALRQGRVLAGVAAPDGLLIAKLGATPVALVEIVAGQVRVERGFNL